MRDVTRLGNAAPETPQIGLRLFFISGRGKLVYAVAARIKKFGDPAYGAAFAGGIVAFENQHQRTLAEFFAPAPVR